MTFQPADHLSLFYFVLILSFVVLSVLYGVYRSNLNLYDQKTAKQRLQTTLIGTAIYLGLAIFWVKLRIFETDLALAVMPFFGLSNLFAIFFGLSSTGLRLAQGLPVSALVGFQAFRFPLELVLHAWANQGTIPNTMTWTGQNFDIISGLIALITAPFSNNHRILAWIANLTGLVLLLNVMRVAILSSPLPFSWKVNPPLLLGYFLPYALIVPVCVAGALAGHIILTRNLISKSTGSQ